MAHGIITVEQLTALVDSGEIDTVITAVCDMQGRLVGKRVTGHHFVNHCLDHGTHFCTYLLGTEMDLTTPEGFRGLTWESGYGDYIGPWSIVPCRISPQDRPESLDPAGQGVIRVVLLPPTPSWTKVPSPASPCTEPASTGGRSSGSPCEEPT